MKNTIKAVQRATAIIIMLIFACLIVCMRSEEHTSELQSQR